MSDDAAPMNPVPTAEEMVRDLRQLVNAVELGGRAILPTSDDALLQSIVVAATRIFGAAAAAILLVDEAEQKLVFRVAIGRNPERPDRRAHPHRQGHRRLRGHDRPGDCRQQHPAGRPLQRGLRQDHRLCARFHPGHARCCQASE